MMPVMRTFATCAILLAFACSTPASQADPQGPSDVAARVGSRSITVRELDERWRQNEPAEQAQAVQRIYDGRKDALDSIVSDMLIQAAAKAKGIEQAKFTEAELASRMQPVTDAQVAAFFKENQEQMQGRPLEAMSVPIRRYLEDQGKANAYRALVADLRKAGPRVELVLNVPRYNVNIAADDPALGNVTAPVTIVEFSDFQCPFCQRVVPTIKRITQTYGDRVRVVWKDFPLTQIHPQAFKAAEAAQCAREQGKFWEYHDQLFANQRALEPEFLKKYAADTGLDASKFAGCLDSARFAERVQGGISAGSSLGVGSTPSLFINGRMLSGAQPYETFAAIIDEELERAARK